MDISKKLRSKLKFQESVLKLKAKHGISTNEACSALNDLVSLLYEQRMLEDINVKEKHYGSQTGVPINLPLVVTSTTGQSVPDTLVSQPVPEAVAAV